MHTTRNMFWMFVGLPALLLTLAPSGYAQGPTFKVHGTIYSAQALEEGQTRPRNPLSGETLLTTDPNSSSGSLALVSTVVGGKNLYPVQELGMVRLSLEDATTNRELASAELKDTGTYSLQFTLPLRIDLDPSGVEPLPPVVLPGGGALPQTPVHRVRFVVRDAATQSLLLRSEPVSVWAGDSNQRWVLVETEARQIGKTVPFAAPGAFHFTRVGRIPSHWITADGLAQDRPSEPISRYLPEYDGAPFGGTLLLFGGFEPKVYEQAEDYCYQVLVNGKPLTTPLVKTRYTVQGGRSRAEAVTLTPTNPWVSHCHQPTPISAQGTPTGGSTVFWNYPDLLAYWPTVGSPGKVAVSVKLFRRGSTQPVALQAVRSQETGRSVSELTLHINNQPLEVAWSSIQLDTGGKNLADPGNACPITHLPTGSALDVDFVVEHPFVKQWSFVLQRNLGAVVHTTSGTAERPDSHAALRIAAGNFPESCAYRFGLYALAKTTNGYGYLFRRSIHAAYYLTR